MEKTSNGTKHGMEKTLNGTKGRTVRNAEWKKPNGKNAEWDKMSNGEKQAAWWKKC
jgi:hypothetical protein